MTFYKEFYTHGQSVFKGNLRSKKKFSLNERAWKMQNNKSITDLNAPNGSRDIPFQSQELK